MKKKKIGILTFHYSCNYGGVLQAVALYKYIFDLGFDVEIINYIPEGYKPNNFMKNIKIKENIRTRNFNAIKLGNLVKKIKILKEYNHSVLDKFDEYLTLNTTRSNRIDEKKIEEKLMDYEVIVVGSDQIWNPSQRRSRIYFLDFGEKFVGRKISYAADSTVSEVKTDELDILKKALNDFESISVRNNHTFEFVKTVTQYEPIVTCDPTLLIELECSKDFSIPTNKYILMYVLGREIDGTHQKVIEKIKKKYGNIQVYSIKTPSMNYQECEQVDRCFYDLSPDAWIDMVRNAEFVYTDSFHGVIFSLKYHKPFLAYYNEKMRASRFIDIGERYGVERYIIQNYLEIDIKKSLDIEPNFSYVDEIITKQKIKSKGFLEDALISNE